MKRFPNKQKAIDLAIWQNLRYRFEDGYGVVHSSHGDFMVVPKDHPSFEKTAFESFENRYADIDYKHIRHIAMDIDPLSHWDEIRGMFSTASGETLRFLLHGNITLEKFIRYELACRGYDENFQWVGFDKAEKIWLK